MNFAERLKFVAKQAALRLPELSDAERIQLLEGLELLFGQVSRPADAEQCRLAIHAIRAAEDAQLLLVDMLANDQ